MENLTYKEEEIMQIIWRLKKAFVKDIIAELPDSDQPYTTVASIVRLLEKKGYVEHRSYGRMHEYMPLVSRSDFRKRKLKSLVSQYFDNSFENMVSFLAKEEKVSPEEMEKIVNEIKTKPSYPTDNDTT